MASAEPLQCAAAHLTSHPPLSDCCSQIFVRGLSGATVTVNDLASSDAVSACCAKLAAKQGFECEDVRLVFEGKQLEAGMQLGDYGVEHGARLPSARQERQRPAKPCAAQGAQAWQMSESSSSWEQYCLWHTCGRTSEVARALRAEPISTEAARRTGVQEGGGAAGGCGGRVGSGRWPAAASRAMDGAVGR